MRYFRNQDICVRLEGDSINGANSFSFDSSYSSPKVEVVGKGILTRSYGGKNESVGSISALILDDGSDLYSKFIANSGVISNGSLGSSDVNFNFNQGYINSYTLNGGVSTLPSDSIEFVAYGEIENEEIDPQDNIGEKAFKSKSIFIGGLDRLETEHIQSFNYSISTSWKPSYIMGTHLPVNVSRVEGYTISLDLDLIVAGSAMDSVMNDFEKFISGSNDLTITITGCDETIIYSMPKANIESEGLTASVDGFLEGSIKFQSFVNNLEDLEIAP